MSEDRKRTAIEKLREESPGRELCFRNAEGGLEDAAEWETILWADDQDTIDLDAPEL